VFEAFPVRVIFGSGTVGQLKAEAKRLRVCRVLDLTTPGRGEVQATRSQPCARRTCMRGAAMQTPISVAGRSVQIVSERAVDAAFRSVPC
jgi:maleylacetate reductase